MVIAAQLNLKQSIQYTVYSGPVLGGPGANLWKMERVNLFGEI